MKNRFRHLKPIDIGASIFLLGLAALFGTWPLNDRSDYSSLANMQSWNAQIANGRSVRGGAAPAADSTGAVLIPKQPAISYVTAYLEATDRLKEQGIGIARRLRIVRGTDTTVIVIPAIDHTRDREVLRFIAKHETTTVATQESSFVFVAREDTLTTSRTPCIESMLREIPQWLPYGVDSVDTRDRLSGIRIVF